MHVADFVDSYFCKENVVPSAWQTSLAFSVTEGLVYRPRTADVRSQL